MKNKDEILIKIEDMYALCERIKEKVEDEDYEIIKAMVTTIERLSQATNDKASSIKRLLKIIFGECTEKFKNVFNEPNKEENGSDEAKTSTDESNKNDEKIDDNENKKKKRKKKPGHGRRGVADYPGADRIRTHHSDLNSGDSCPLCLKGKVYTMKDPKVTIRFEARAPVHATIYENEKLRCNLCGKIFTSELPDTVKNNKYDETVGSIIALLKYGGGFPFNRLEQLQANFGIPLSASTQWDIEEAAADKIYKVFIEFCRLGAQGKLIYNDDTTMKILELMNNTKNDNEKKRSGIFTTGILCIVGDHKIALYFTGRNHAGENMSKLLAQRGSGLDPPIQMCDALSRNIPKEFETILCNCMSHARRKFIDVAWNFPQECRYVLEILAKVYKNDEITKKNNMSDDERLKYHQTQSDPLMKGLKKWLNEQFDEKKIEPNSSMGTVFSYMLNHWEPLTRFLHVPGAPLDNNLCEQILKKSILHRKNSLFYKTQHGAYIGDLFMSLIQTCRLAGVNAFDYLTTLQKFSHEVFKNPGNWLPWNYTAAASTLSHGP